MSKTLPRTLESIEKMSELNPDMIIVYLSETDYESFDKNILFKHPNVTIRITDDIKSYKKYVALTEREFDGDAVFILDDDVVYKPDTYKNLYDEYERHPDRTDTVYATWCKAFGNRNEMFVSDRYHVPRDTEPNEWFVFCSGWGLLIPPHVMRTDYDTIKNGFEYGNNGGQNYISDDKLMSAYCKSNNIKCACVYSVQKQITFKGDTPLCKSRVGKSNIHALQAMRYFDNPERDRITVSVCTTNTRRINDLNNQTLPPDKIIVTVKPNTKIPNKLQSIPNVEIQYSDNPQQHRYTPDTDTDDLVFVIPDSVVPNDTIENMFAEYYSTQYGYIHTAPVRFTKTQSFGFKPTPDMTRNVFRRKHSDNLPNTQPDSFVQTILHNQRITTDPSIIYQQRLTT